MTKTNKKGFTLVELIIVIAILAILIAALAPALIKYIEKSRISKDVSSLDNVYNAIRTALANEEVNSDLTTGDTWLALDALLDDANTVNTKLAEELFGDEGTLNDRYALATNDASGNSPFVSKAAKDAAAKVYYKITSDYKLTVSLSKPASAGTAGTDKIPNIGD